MENKKIKDLKQHTLYRIVLRGGIEIEGERNDLQEVLGFESPYSEREIYITTDKSVLEIYKLIPEDNILTVEKLNTYKTFSLNS